MSHTFITDFGKVIGNHDLSGDLTVTFDDKMGNENTITIKKSQIIDLHNFIIQTQLVQALSLEIDNMASNGDVKSLQKLTDFISKRDKTKPLQN